MTKKPPAKVAEETLSLFAEEGAPVGAAATTAQTPTTAPFDLDEVADVALPLPVDTAFTYAIPASMKGAVEPGARVLCPFGPHKKLGIVVAVRAPTPRDVAMGGRLRPLAALVDATPVLPAELLAFLREMARYYLAPLGEVIALAVPAVERKTMTRLRALGEHAPIAAKIAPSHVARWVRRSIAAIPDDARIHPTTKSLLDAIGDEAVEVAALTERFSTAPSLLRTLQKKGWIVIEERTVERSPFTEASIRDAPPSLNDEQRGALDAILEAIAREAIGGDVTPRTFLLHGVTGSGKTEIYLHAIADALERGLGALMLVPEIALTPQLVARFRARFGDDVAVVHSALDPAARHAMWKRLHAGELRVAIGARSALFAPVPNLGVVIVDEEHDGSFKQEEGVRYHARDGALLRAHRAKAVCILGSATPSIESIALGAAGKLRVLRMIARATPQPLPKVHVLDLRHIGPGPSGSRLITLPLHRAIDKALLAGEQTILFLNRRGFSPSVRCEACGDLRRCAACEVALTLHQKKGARIRRGPRGQESESVPAGLRCHYCDHHEPLPPRCPKCGGTLALDGIGTERLEEVLATAFPKARVARLDRDVAGGNDVEAILKRVRAREVDILVGTQMVTKGHDLPHVTLVGVVNADGALSMPDFRASERTFQLLVQVAGRAGRGDMPGEVYIQTRAPEHPAIACAARHDVDAFLERELEDRRELSYPPFSRMVLVRLDGLDDEATQQAAKHLADVARETAGVQRGEVDVGGPAPAPMPRIRDRFRHRVVLRGQRGPLLEVARQVQRAAGELPRAVRVIVDVDPVGMM